MRKREFIMNRSKYKRSRRSTVIVLVLAMLITMFPASGPPSAHANDADTAGTSNEKQADISTLNAMGLKTDASDDNNSVFGSGNKSMNVRSELLLDFNGSQNYGWILRENLNLSSDGGSAKTRGAYALYGLYTAADWIDIKADEGNNYGQTGGSSTVISSSIASRNTHLANAYATETAYHSSSGKSDRVARLRVTSAVNRKDSRVYLELMRFNSNNQLITVKSRFLYKVGDSGYFNKYGSIYNDEYDASMEITAGDFNGDGTDEIAVYAANGKIEIYTTGNDTISLWKTITVENVNSLTQLDTDTSGVKTSQIPFVSMTAGDLKKDGTDDLIVGWYCPDSSNDLSNKNNVTIYEYDGSNLIADEVIGMKGTGENAHYNIGLGVGDLTGNGRPELVIASNKPSVWGKSEVIHVEYNHSSESYDIDAPQAIESGTHYQNGKGHYGTGGIVPEAVAIADLNGRRDISSEGYNGGYLFVQGSLFTYSDGIFSKRGDDTMSFLGEDTLYDLAGDKIDQFDQQWLSHVIVGNFDGNRAGKEQIIAVHGDRTGERYDYQIGYLAMDDSGTINSSSEGVLCNANSYLNQGSKSRASCYLAISAPDMDNDSMVLHYSGSDTTYSQPEVQAVLQSAPYFQDVEDAYGYLSNGATAYGTSEGSGNSVTASVSAGVGVYASAEASLFVAAEFEVETKATMTYEYEHNWSTETSVEYSGNAGDDYAVVYTIPYHNYYYKAYDPNVNGCKIDDESTWVDVLISVPLDPVVTMITVDKYDAIAAQTIGLEPIRGNILTSTAGEPSTYQTWPSQAGSFKSIGTQQLLSNAAPGSLTTISREESTESNNSFSVGVEANIKAGVGTGFLGNGGTAGMVASTSADSGYVRSNMNGVTYTGAVDNLPEEADEFSTNWQFGISQAKLNNEDIMVVGYKTSNIVQPPASPANLTVTDTASDSMTLQWEPSAEAASYKLFMRRESGSYVSAGTIPGTAKNSDGMIEFKKTELSPDTNYSFYVQAVSGGGRYSMRSSTAQGSTLPAGIDGEFRISTQPDDQSAYAGGSATFAMQAVSTTGQQISFQWETYSTSSKTWRSINGANQSTYTVRNVSESMNGQLYRCQVSLPDGVSIYTRSAVLTVDRAASKSEISITDKNGTAVDENTIIQASGTTTGYRNETRITYPVITYTEGDLTYTKMGIPASDYSEGGTDNSGNETAPVYNYLDNMIWMTKSADASGNITVKYYADSSSGSTQKPDTDNELKPEEVISFASQSAGENAYADMYTTSGSIEDADSKEFTINGKTIASSKAYKVKDNDAAFVYVVTSADTENASTNYYYVNGSEDPVPVTMQYSDAVFTFTKNDGSQTTAELSDYTEVRKQTQESVSVPVQETVDGDKLTLTASVTGGTGSADPSGDVTFRIRNTATGEVSSITGLLSNTTASISNYTFSAGGIYKISVSYAGDGRYLDSLSDEITVYVADASEGRTLTIAGGSMVYGSSLALEPSVITKNTSSSSISAASNVSYTVYELNSSGTEIKTDLSNSFIRNDTFTPLRSGNFVIYASCGSGKEGLSTKTYVTVTRKTLTIRANDGSDTINGDNHKQDNLTAEVTGTAGGDAVYDSDYSLSSDVIDADSPGNYAVNVALTRLGENRLSNKYTTLLMSGIFTLSETGYPVTVNTDSHGTVSIIYESPNSTSESGYNSGQTLISGTPAPEGSKVTITASPLSGYAVDKWTTGDDNATVTDKNGGTTGTASYSGNTIEIDNLTSAQSFTVTYKEVYHKLTLESSDGGTLTGVYKTNGQSSSTPISSGSSVRLTDSFQLTATPEDGYVIQSWSIKQGDNETEIIKAGDNSSNYTYTNYDISGINEDTTVTVTFVKNKTHTITVKPVDGSGNPLTQENLVSANGIELQRGADGSYSFTADEYSNPVITLNLTPDLMVQSWTDNDGKAVDSQYLSSSNETLSLYAVQKDQIYTVTATAPNKYALTFGGQLVDKDGNPSTETFTDDCGTVTAQIINGSTINSGEKVQQGSSVIVTAKANEGYELVSAVTSGNSKSAETTSIGGGADEYTIQVPSLSAAANVTYNFRKQPKITLNIGNGGTAAAAGTLRGTENTTISSDGYVDFGSSSVDLTVSPVTGYEIDTVKIDNKTVTGSAIANSDSKSFTYEPDAGIKDDLTIYITFKALPAATVTYSVIDTMPDADGGLNGMLTASSARNNMDTYKIGQLASGSSVYRDSTVEFTAVPAEGYKVGQWFLNGKEVSSQLQLTITDASAQNVQVRFDPVGQAVTYGFTDDSASADNIGSLSAEFEASGSGSQSEFASGNIPATDGTIKFTLSDIADGYEIEGWYINGIRQEGESGSSFNYDVKAGTGADIRAKVIRSSYTVEFSAQNGTVNAQAAGSDIPSGSAITGDTSVTFTAQPVSNGYSFSHWTVNDIRSDVSEETLSLSVTENTSVTAVYTLDQVKYTINYGVLHDSGGNENGTLTASGLSSSPAQADAGRSITFTAVPAEGYQVKGWYSDADASTPIAGTAAEQNTYNMTNLTGDMNVYVAFEAIPEYDITVSTTGRGKITAAVNGQNAEITDGRLTVKSHDSVVLSAVPDEDQHLINWTLNNESRGNDLTLSIQNVTAPQNIIAEFGTSQYVTFKTECGDGGALKAQAGHSGGELKTINASNGMQLETGKDIKLTLSPDAGKMVSSWSINGTAVTENNMDELGVTMDHSLGNSMTISNIRRSTTVTVTFEDEKLYSIPSGTDTYTISDIEKNPDSYGGDSQIRRGGSVSFAVKPAEGKTISAITTSENASAERLKDGTYKVTADNVQADITITVEVSDGIPLIIASGENGTVTVSRNGTELTNADAVQTGDVLTITAAPDSGWRTASLTVNGKSFKSGSTYTVSPEDTAVSVAATFAVSGGGSTASTAYSIKIDSAENGTVTSSHEKASRNTEVTITAKPDLGFMLDTINVTDSSGNEIKLTESGSGFTFAMPASDVTVRASFAKDDSRVKFRFVDVYEDDYFYDAVYWAVENGITSGVDETHFAPYVVCTRAQAVTLLWNNAGKPEPAGNEMPFSDVSSDDYYHDAVLWAVENGITAGTSDTTFSPDMNCSRAQIASLIWRFEKPEPVVSHNRFTDVSDEAYYYDAVLWAAHNGITVGTSDTTFSPENDCTRSQIVTFIYRFMNR